MNVEGDGIFAHTKMIRNETNENVRRKVPNVHRNETNFNGIEGAFERSS